MKKAIKIFLITSLIAAVTAVFAIAREVKFEAEMDKARVALGEVAQLNLSFYGTQSMPAPDIGNIDGLEMRYIGPSTMMTVINGKVSSSVTHRYTVLPLKIGKFQLGPFSFKYKGDDYASNAVALEVTEERVAPVREEPREALSAEKLDLADRVFLTLDVGKMTAYVNELVPVTVKLYVNRLNVSDIQLPTFVQEGFSKVEFREPKQYREQMSGLIYDVLEFKTSIFGTRPGDFRIGPAKIKCSVMMKKAMAPSPGMRDDRFDEFFKDSYYEDFFTRYERHPLELKSPDMRLIISPLPSEGRPKDFSGAVGDYQFIFNASPVKLKTGDPITLKMDINGTGNFNTVLMPRLENTDGFKVYEPQIKTEEHRKSFGQVLIPETDGITQIPKAVFNYFDPDSRQYKTITQGPIPIHVEKGKDEAPSQVIGPTVPTYSSPVKQEPLARDIIYIKEAPANWQKKGRRAYKGKIFLALFALPLALLVSLYAFQHRRNRLRRDTRYARRIAAYRLAKVGLRNLRRGLKTNDQRAYYEMFFKALQDYLGNRLDVSPAGTTYDVVAEILLAKDADMDVLRKIKNLFDTCDKARFANLAVEEYKMKDDLRELEEVIKYLERNRI